jgi:tetratricopeptide (TPR) repeat protein/TolB-like protein
MASIIHGYEHDVFISYRQNDNKYDGWVSAFVHNLTIELEATIKDKISVYFDVDPIDGLLESHSVDRSLEDKLKCLIFIPIISRTYCDKNAFAWRNEFCAFNRLAREDTFGRDIRLYKGNFASRILPVRIHELEREDMSLIENELGGSLRSIDFIYKSAGVNRPLRAFEDHPHDNLNNTYYRDQINKVANAISEILTVLRDKSSCKTAEKTTIVEEPEKEIVSEESKQMHKKTFFPVRNKKWIFILVLLAAVAVFLLLIYPAVSKRIVQKSSGTAGERITIAVMPFHNLTNDSTLNYLRLGAQEGVVNNLLFYPEEFNVRPFDLIRSFLKNKSISYYSSLTSYSGIMISRKLDADVLLLGDINKSGEIIRLSAKLFDSKTKEIIRPFIVEGVSKNIMFKIDTLSEMVRKYLMISKIGEKTFQPGLSNIYKVNYLTNSPDAYRYHYLALEAFYSFDFKAAIRFDSLAVSIDSGYIAPIISLCWENLNNGNYAEAIKWLRKAYTKRKQMPLIKQLTLDYQYACLFQTPEEQIKCLRQLQKIEDNNPIYYLSMGYQYVNLCRYQESVPEFEKAQEIYKKWDSEPNDIYYYHYLIRAYHKTGQNKKVKEFLLKAEKNLIKDNQGSMTGDQYLKIAVIYSDAGSYDKAEEYFNKAVLLEPRNPDFLHFYAASLIENNMNVPEGLKLIDKALMLNPDNATYLDTKGWGLYRQHKYKESLEILEKAYHLIPSYEIKAHIDSVKAALDEKD